MKPEEVRIGDYVRYREQDTHEERALQIISNPFTINGQWAVTCRRGCGGRRAPMVGMYALDALEPWPGILGKARYIPP